MNLQRFYYVWKPFLNPQLLEACETQGSYWSMGAPCPPFPSPHRRGSPSPLHRDGFALGKGSTSSAKRPVGFCCCLLGGKKQSPGEVVMWGVALPCRQTRGAAGGRRDRLQELHQENPVGTSQPWDIALLKRLGHGEAATSSTQISSACCGTPSLWLCRDGTDSKGLSFASPRAPAHIRRHSCACGHPKICPFAAHDWMAGATW